MEQEHMDRKPEHDAYEEAARAPEPEKTSRWGCDCAEKNIACLGPNHAKQKPEGVDVLTEEEIAGWRRVAAENPAYHPDTLKALATIDALKEQLSTERQWLDTKLELNARVSELTEHRDRMRQDKEKAEAALDEAMKWIETHSICSCERDDDKCKLVELLKRQS